MSGNEINEKVTSGITAMVEKLDKIESVIRKIATKYRIKSLRYGNTSVTVTDCKIGVYNLDFMIKSNDEQFAVVNYIKKSCSERGLLISVTHTKITSTLNNLQLSVGVNFDNAPHDLYNACQTTAGSPGVEELSMDGFKGYLNLISEVVSSATEAGMNFHWAGSDVNHYQLFGSKPWSDFIFAFNIHDDFQCQADSITTFTKILSLASKPMVLKTIQFVHAVSAGDTPKIKVSVKLKGNG